MKSLYFFLHAAIFVETFLRDYLTKTIMDHFAFKKNTKL